MMDADEGTIRPAGFCNAAIRYRGKMPLIQGVQGIVLVMEKEPGGSL